MAATRKLTSAQIHWFRLRRSGLVEPFKTAEETARKLIGVQAQLPAAANLAFWNRVSRCKLADLEKARLTKRSLVRFWGQRNTVHLYRAVDWPFLHTVFSERQALLQRRLKKAGLYADFQKLVDRTAKRLAAGEELTYKEIKSKKLEANDKWVVAYVVFMELVRNGVTCHGPDRGNQSTFIHRERWLPKLAWSPPKPEKALGELALRYFQAYGPAELRDLAFWYGTTVTEAKKWVALAGKRCESVEVDGRTFLYDRRDADELAVKPPAPSRWPVRMLYRFDPLLLATKDKSWLIDEESYKEVWRAAAHVEAVLLVRGRIAGTWRYERTSKKLKVKLKPFTKLTQSVTKTVEQQSSKIASFLGLELGALDVQAPE